MRRGFLRSLQVLVLAMLALSLIQPPAVAISGIRVYFNGGLMQFDDVEPVIVNDRTLVPFRKLFETLGYSVQWVNATRQAMGTKDGVTILLTIDSTIASVNGQDVALDVPPQIINDRTLIPLRFVAENSGYEVGYSREGGVSTITIGGAPASAEPQPPVPAPADETVEPFVAKGRVTDGDGNPMVGMSVFVANQLDYTSYLEAVTDENGYYRVELPPFATTWRVTATHTVTRDGKPYRIDLVPHIDQPFGTSKGGIRNLTFDLSRASVFVDLDFGLAVNGGGGYSMENVVVTLVPLGPSWLGGSGGEPVVDIPTVRQEYMAPSLIVPVARYAAMASYIVGDGAVPMLIRQRNTGEYAEFVEFDFLPEGYPEEFEVKLEVLPIE